jgi:hypothetical protein
VEYYTIKELRQKKLNIEELPFIRRRAFRGEKEFRLLYEGKNAVQAV